MESNSCSKIITKFLLTFCAIFGRKIAFSIQLCLKQAEYQKSPIADQKTRRDSFFRLMEDRAGIEIRPHDAEAFLKIAYAGSVV